MKTYTFPPVFIFWRNNRPLHRLAAATNTFLRLSLLGWALLFSQASWGQSAPVKEWDKTFASNYYTPSNAVNRSIIIISASDGGYLLANNNTYQYQVIKISSNGTEQWVKRYGGTENDYFYDYFTSAIQTADGGFLLAGYSTSPISGDKTQNNWGSYDYWVVKITSTGIKQWDKRYGGIGVDYLSSVIQTADGGFLLAGYSGSPISGDRTQDNWGNNYYGDYWVVKITSTGSKQWDKRYGGTGDDKLTSAIQTADGGFLLSGSSNSTLSGDKTQNNWGNNYDDDYWVVKITSTGSKQWDKRYGGTGDDKLTSAIQTADGGFLLAGYSGSPISGDKTQNNWGNNYYGDYWVVKITSTGSKQWDKRFGGTHHDVLTSAIQTADGGFLLSGYSSSPISGDKTQGNWGDLDYWVVKITSIGSKQWDKRYGGTGGDVLYSAIQTADGGFLLAGDSNSPVSGDKTQSSGYGEEIWLVKTTREPMINEAVMSSTTPIMSIGSDYNYYDPGFVVNYTNNLDVTQTLSPICRSACYVRLSFTSFQLENNYDYLYIYDGCSTSAPLIGVYTGINSPGTVTSTSGCLTLRFVSDYSVVFSGWKATITRVAPGARLSAEEEAPDAGSPLRLVASPNPFSERVNLSFQVAQTQPVVLAVYDKQGRFVEQVFSGEAQGGKAYQLDWAAKNQKAGFYIARLSTGSQVVHQKLILVR